MLAPAAFFSGSVWPRRNGPASATPPAGPPVFPNTFIWPLLAGPPLDLVLVGGDPGVRDRVDALAVEVDLADQGIHLVIAQLIGLGNLVGDRPFVLHAGPGVFPDLAVRLAAIVGEVLVLAPRRIAVALGRPFRELHPLALVFRRRP